MINGRKDFISQQSSADLFALASYLQAKRHQDYSTAELLQAGAEANISPEIIHEALQIIQNKQIQDQNKKRNLRLMLGSGVLGAAIALSGVWAYTTINKSPAWGVPQVNHKDSTIATAVVNNYTTTFTGKVQQYLLNPEGRVEGLLLNNGIQVKFRPNFADNITEKITPKTEISVIGQPGIPTRFGQEIQANEITNLQTQETLTSQQDPGAFPPPRPQPGNYSNLSTVGTLQQWLVGHRGEVNGLILSNEVQVKFPPHVGEHLVNMGEINQKIQVQGFGTQNRYGQIIQATNLSVNGRNVEIAPPMPKHFH